MAVKLNLDGVRVPGSEIKLQVTFSISTEDASGQSSSTADIDTGHKAQVIRVRMLVTSAEDLKTIRGMAGKLLEDGSRHIFTIVNDTTDSMDIRQVKFVGDMAVREDQALRAWRTTFLLKEHRSVAEKQEQQQEEKDKTEVEQSTTSADEVEPEESTELTAFESWLAEGEEWAKEFFE